MGMAATTKSGYATAHSQSLHAAHGAARHRQQTLDAEMIDQHLLQPHHVGDGDDGKAHGVGLAGAGSIEPGPVVPRQPPRTLLEITK